MLQGDFEASYTRADNSLVVPTDTMKNTVNALAWEKLGSENEEFALALGQHFLDTYPQVGQVDIGLAERCWDRLTVGGKPHDHAFAQKDSARWTVRATRSRGGNSVESGIENLLILKTTGSGFGGFPKDKHTTLAETNDRIFATQLKAQWTHDKRPASYSQTNGRIIEAMLSVFAANYSPSVQVTLFQMGEAALKTAPEVSKVHLAMPNKHCLLIQPGPIRPG